MHQNFNDSIYFYQAVYKMHTNFRGNSETRSFAGFIKIPFYF